MRKIILTVTMIISLTTASFGYGMHEVNSFSSSSFPPPTLNLAS
ncbi:hypothetical protein [Candidatus Francisella endociliophora]|nr:hypothetical protein [Francisella sp. FSC1006]